MPVLNYILAFGGGTLGAVIGGTAGFVCAGAMGLFTTVLAFCGIHIPFCTDILRDILVFPAVVFNGGAVAVACASRRGTVDGRNASLSVLPLKDPAALLAGGCAGLCGYIITHLEIPFMDCGALAVFTVNLAARLLFGKCKVFNRAAVSAALPTLPRTLCRDLLLSVPVALGAALLVQTTNVLSMAFYCSAFSLICSYFIKGFPVTHHITMCAGYGIFLTGSLPIALLMGLAAHVVFRLFTICCNTDCHTHLDEPAFAIWVISMPLLAVFC